MADQLITKIQAIINYDATGDEFPEQNTGLIEVIREQDMGDIDFESGTRTVTQQIGDPNPINLGVNATGDVLLIQNVGDNPIHFYSNQDSDLSSQPLVGVESGETALFRVGNRLTNIDGDILLDTEDEISFYFFVVNVV